MFFFRLNSSRFTADLSPCARDICGTQTSTKPLLDLVNVKKLYQKAPFYLNIIKLIESL